MAFSTALYNSVFKRNSVFVTATFVAAFGFTLGFDEGLTRFHDWWNRGKQWKDIRHKYIQDDSE